eukprot:GGOE01044499.1.p1 GENE.GGOE01044499.1~~GGOE01044499.1.p1  ORF type:complete len:870 (+),score=193.56 GGOE01044499.1:38-2647(+)
MADRPTRFTALFPRHSRSVSPQQRSLPQTSTPPPHRLSSFHNESAAVASPLMASRSSSSHRPRPQPQPQPSTPPKDGGKPMRSARNGVAEPRRESWILMVEGRSGHLKVMDKPPLGLCSQCEANVRAAYDGACQTLSRLRWERRWQKQVQLEIDAVKQMYCGKVSFPDAVHRLQAEVDSLQGVIDALLGGSPLPEDTQATVRFHGVQRELEAERAQNALLEAALQELQLAMQEEDARLAEENRQMRTAMQQLQKTAGTADADGFAMDGVGDGGIMAMEIALQAERAVNDGLRQRLQELETSAPSFGTSRPAHGSRPAEAVSQEREYLEDKLLAMEQQMGAVVEERDALQARLSLVEGVQPGLTDSPYSALKLESELVTLRGELIVERQAHDTAKSQLELERERRALLEKRMEEDTRELTVAREECLVLTAKLNQAQQQRRNKVPSTLERGLSPANFEPIDGGQEFYRQRASDLQQALSAEKLRNDTLQQEMMELRYQTTAAQRNEKVLSDQLQVLMDELKAKESALNQAEEALKVHKRVQQEQDRELRRLRDEMQVLRGRGGRTTPSHLSKTGSGRTSPSRSAASPPSSPVNSRTSQMLAQSALKLSVEHDLTHRRSSDGSAPSDGEFARPVATVSPSHPPSDARPAAAFPISAVGAEEELQAASDVPAGRFPISVPRLGLDEARPTPLSGPSALASDRTVDPGSPKTEEGERPSQSPDPVEPPQLRISVELQDAANKDPHVSQILWELRDAQRRHLLDRGCALLIRAEADTILDAAQHLRERVTSLPKWPGTPLSDAPLNAPRRASLPHATRVVEGVTLYEAIRRAAEGVVDRPFWQPDAVTRSPPVDTRCWQVIADATEALHRLLDA